MRRRWLAGAALGLALAFTQVAPGAEAGGLAGKVGSLSIGGDTGKSYLQADGRTPAPRPGIPGPPGKPGPGPLGFEGGD